MSLRECLRSLLRGSRSASHEIVAAVNARWNRVDSDQRTNCDCKSTVFVFILL